jgi:hypothetical protein
MICPSDQYIYSDLPSVGQHECNGRYLLSQHPAVRTSTLPGPDPSIHTRIPARSPVDLRRIQYANCPRTCVRTMQRDQSLIATPIHHLTCQKFSSNQTLQVKEQCRSRNITGVALLLSFCQCVCREAVNLSDAPVTPVTEVTGSLRSCQCANQGRGVNVAQNRHQVLPVRTPLVYSCSTWDRGSGICLFGALFGDRNFS